MTADAVRVSYTPANERVADALDTDAYRSYLRSAHAGQVDPGTEWSEFVGRGCGAAGDVTLRVEAVVGGATIGATTAFVFQPRADRGSRPSSL